MNKFQGYMYFRHIISRTWRFLLRFYFQHSISTLSAEVQNLDIVLKVSQNAGTSASNYQNTEVSALSALVLVKGKVVPAETAETDLQKAEGTTLQFILGC